jgi:hypothetical protein
MCRLRLRFSTSGIISRSWAEGGEPGLVASTSHDRQFGGHRQPKQTRRTIVYLRSDQYTRVTHDCPVNIDLHPADDIVEITLGEHRIAGDTLRLLFDHPDTCLRIAEALHDARNKLIGHLHAKASHDPAMSQLDSISSASMAS